MAPICQVYHAMVARTDANIGKLVTVMKSSGMYDGSLIAFSSDNGGPITQATYSLVAYLSSVLSLRAM